MSQFLCLSLLLSLGLSPAFSENSLAQQAVKSPESVKIKDYTHITKEDKDARMKWWRDDKFGIFIHFGLYAVPAGEYKGRIPHPCAEWIMNFAQIPALEYRKYAKQLTLSKFDADQWAKAIADSGAKYVVITTKHHDGFCMFDSTLTPYNIKQATPYGKDFLKQLSDACKKHGLKFCTYYSVLEWDNPALGTIPAKDKAKYLPYMKGQLAELISKYDTNILWFDGEWENWWKDEDGREIYNYLRTLKPDILVNNRITKARQGMGGMNKENAFGADFGTPEQEVPDGGLPGVDWESCMTMNKSWGYSQKDEDWKSAETLVHHLIDTASKGGNYLLNIGPRPDGTIPEASLERLAEVGKWMKTNGRAIYGTQMSPFKKLPWGRATQKDGDYYFFVYSRPEDGKVLIPFKSKGKIAAETLADGKPLPIRQTSRGILVDLKEWPAESSLPSVFHLKGKGIVIDAVSPENNGKFALDPDSADLSGGVKIQESASSGQLVGASEKRAKNIGFWTKPEGRIEWKLNVPKTGNYTVEITYSCNKGTGDTPVTISSGKNSLTWNVPETGAWNNYRTVTAGSLALEGGKTTLRLSTPAAPKEGVANIRAITLTPIK